MSEYDDIAESEMYAAADLDPYEDYRLDADQERLQAFYASPEGIEYQRRMNAPLDVMCERRGPVSVMRCVVPGCDHSAEAHG